MIIELHTPGGPVQVDSKDLTDEELATYGYHKLHRAEELLSTSPDVITAPETWELLRIFAVWIGITPRPTG